MNHFIDFIGFPLVMGYFGLVNGWLAMTLIILVVNYLNIKIYQAAGIASLFVWLEEVKAGKSKSTWAKILSPILAFGFMPTFLVLCFEDPAKAFFWARGSKLKNRFTPRDWYVFVITNLIGGGIWALAWSGFFNALKLLLVSYGLSL